MTHVQITTKLGGFIPLNVRNASMELNCGLNNQILHDVWWLVPKIFLFKISSYISWARVAVSVGCWMSMVAILHICIKCDQGKNLQKGRNSPSQREGRSRSRCTLLGQICPPCGRGGSESGFGLLPQEESIPHSGQPCLWGRGIKGNFALWCPICSWILCVLHAFISNRSMRSIGHCWDAFNCYLLVLSYTQVCW